MSPEDARYWLGHSTRPPLIPPYIAQQALETIAAMGYEYSLMRPHNDTHINVERWHPSLEELHDIDPPDTRDKIAQRLVTPAKEFYLGDSR